MRIFSSLILASCLPSIVLGHKKKSGFQHSVIIEYEDWATEDNNALLENVKSGLGSSSHVDSVDVTTRLEFSSSIFRGLSASINGEGSGVSMTTIQKHLQLIPGVKKVSPVTTLHTNAQAGQLPRALLQQRSEESALKSGSHTAGGEASTAPSTHVMTGVDKLHAAGFKGKGVTIAIMDTGFDYKQKVFGNSIGPGKKITYGYDWVGDAFTGYNKPVEDKDPYADCSTHGTHVLGIVGADPTDFGLVGVAPEATFELHRVFGCDSRLPNDVAIKASLAIFKRGVDIITASIGAEATYPDDPWSTVVQRINEAGTYFNVAAGNSGAGYYTGVTPGSGIDVVAVGAVMNTETPTYLWNGTYGPRNVELPWIPGDKVSFPPTFNIWTASPNETDPINAGCGPYPKHLELPDFNTTTVLIVQPFIPPCFASDAMSYLETLGAKHVLFYISTPDDPNSGPAYYEATDNITGVGGLPYEVGHRLFADYQKNKSIAVSLGSISALNDSVTYQKNTISGGRMASYSSWGPTEDGRTFPTFSAPGGNILSTAPRKVGGFVQLSGTSMATPFAAGVAALLKQKHPDWKSSTIRNVLATTANPAPYNDNTTKVYDFLAPVFQQGGGLVDANRAVHTTTLIDVPGLSFNDTVHRRKSLSFKVKNIGETASTFKLSHIPAASGYGTSDSDPFTAITDYDRQLSNNLQPVYAKLNITPSEVKISPGHEATITVDLVELPNLNQSRLGFYGGYIALNSTDGNQTLTVPYTGIATNLYKTPISEAGSTLAQYNATLDEAFIDPVVKKSTVFTIKYLGPNTQWSNETYWPAVIHFIQSAAVFHTYRYRLLDVNGEVFLDLNDVSNHYVPGSNWYLDGTDGNYTFIKPGQYRFQVGALRIYGNESREEDWVNLDTAPFIIRYSNDSIGLPSHS